jgi:CheY-like chemotaxis protein
MPPAPNPPQLAILIVDDYPDTAESFAHWLRTVGHDARAATSGEDAVRLVADWDPDVAVVDLAMPGMSGVELAGRLAAPPRRRPLLVGISGSVWQTDGAGADAFDWLFLKPIDPERLAAMLADYAAGRASVRPVPA